MIADHGQQGLGQFREKGLERLVLFRRPVALAQIADRHHGTDVVPGIDCLQHLFLDRQVVARQMHVAEHDEMWRH